MRINHLPFIMIAVLLFSCQSERTAVNEFSSSYDTLNIQSKKNRGFSVFPFGAMLLHSKDTSEDFVTSVAYPEGIDQIKRRERYIDFALLRYHTFMNGDEDLLERLEYDIVNKLIDTSACFTESENIINILEGYKDGIRIVIVDNNNNKDLTDDKPYMVDKSWDPGNGNFIECQFRIFNGQENVNEKSWLYFRSLEGTEDLLYGKAEHVVAEFQIDDRVYKVAAINDGVTDFTYDTYNPTSPLFVLLKEGDSEIDYTEEEILQLGQYLNLDGDYYRIEDISHNGGKLTLIKENDFDSKVGTQVGMIAPEFECATIFGDTLYSSELIEKGIIIVNMCGCGGDTESMAAYDSIAALYGDDYYYVLGIDSQFDKKQKGFLIDAEDSFNKDIFENYRIMYCSRMTYVIGRNARIQQKFSSQD